MVVVSFFFSPVCLREEHASQAEAKKKSLSLLLHNPLVLLSFALWYANEQGECCLLSFAWVILTSITFCERLCISLNVKRQCMEKWDKLLINYRIMKKKYIIHPEIKRLWKLCSNFHVVFDNKISFMKAQLAAFFFSVLLTRLNYLNSLEVVKTCLPELHDTSSVPRLPTSTSLHWKI